MLRRCSIAALGALATPLASAAVMPARRGSEVFAGLEAVEAPAAARRGSEAWSSDESSAGSRRASVAVPIVEDIVNEAREAVAAIPSSSSTSLSTSVSASASSHPTPSHKSFSNTPPQRGRLCGTAPPPSELLEHHAFLHAEQELQKRLGPTAVNVKQSALPSVNVHFHIVSATAQSGLVTGAMAALQYNALKAAYAPTGITFTLASVDWTVNDTWAADNDDVGMKTALRKGGYQDLNIYFQTALSSDGSGSAAAQLLGFCTLPTNVTYSPCDGCALATFPASDWVVDGCNVHAGSMPGGWLPGYTLGKTAVHETGHWFGLLHTFQDNTCNTTDPGDYIADTPQQSTATQGCPAGKNSCPTCPGYDAIHNYMDYSDDSCYNHFTPDQISRMQSMFKTLRQGH